jgi:octaprenyl-diphosphate synthase
VIAEGEVMQLAAAKNTETTEDEYLAVIRGKTAALFAAACEVGPIIAGLGKAEPPPAAATAANLGIAFQLVDDALDYGGSSPSSARRSATTSARARSRCPSCSPSAAAARAERAFWSRTMENGEIRDGDLEQAMAIMRRHRAIEDTIERARHYGAMAVDALALFPDAPMKAAMLEAVDFCIARTH